MTRPVRDLTRERGRDASHDASHDDAAATMEASGGVRLSIREREARASDDDRTTNRHLFHSTERTSEESGAFVTTTANYTARLRHNGPSSNSHSTSQLDRTGASSSGTGLQPRSSRRRAHGGSHLRQSPSCAGTRRRPYANQLAGVGFRGNFRGQSLLLEAMTQRTLHEASVLLARATPDVYDSLTHHVSVSSATWDMLSECRAMYTELLETDEGESPTHRPGSQSKCAD